MLFVLAIHSDFSPHLTGLIVYTYLVVVLIGIIEVPDSIDLTEMPVERGLSEMTRWRSLRPDSEGEGKGSNCAEGSAG